MHQITAGIGNGWPQEVVSCIGNCDGIVRTLIIKKETHSAFYHDTTCYTISQRNEFTQAYRSGPWLSGTLTVAWY